MRDHLWSFIVTILVGALCGVIVGFAYTGLLKPLIEAVTKTDRAADWFSGAGTWVVGLAAAVLTFQQHRSINRKDLIARERLRQERDAEMQRQAAMEKAREDKDAREWMSALTDYKVALARLRMVPGHLELAAATSASLRFQEAVDALTLAVATVPPTPIRHSEYLTDANDLAKIAALDSSIANFVSLSSGLLKSLGPGPFTEYHTYLGPTDQASLLKVATAARWMAKLAADAAAAVEEAYPHKN